jgi:hypothetical protein
VPFERQRGPTDLRASDEESVLSKYMLIMRRTDESSAAMMTNIDQMMATTGHDLLPASPCHCVGEPARGHASADARD